MLQAHLPGFRVARLPARVGRRLHLQHRHLDAEAGPELAGAATVRFAVPARAGRVSGRDPDPALLSRRRRHRRPGGPAQAAHRLANRTDVLRVSAGRNVRAGRGPGLAHPDAVVRGGAGAGLRRAGLPGADSLAGAPGRALGGHRLERDPVQPGARRRTGAGRAGADPARRILVLRPQRRSPTSAPSSRCWPWTRGAFRSAPARPCWTA